MDSFYIKTQSMTVGYNGVPLIRDINLSVNRGEILTLIGPNGAGKSTILKTIIRQLASICGTVTLDGSDMAQLSARELARKMSVLMTDRIRPELMSCRDVVATGRYPYTGRLGILSEHDEQVVTECMAQTHASELAQLSFDCISDGQRQRVLLARALCQEPDIIILDEPTSFLDIRHKLELLSLLKKLVSEKNIAVIMSLHELDLAQRISDRVVCVKGDHIDHYGAPEDIFTDNYIRSLYEISKGSYQSEYGTVELEKADGTPKVFVIGGGGMGIPVYRSLQRRGIPFAAGILQENDLDYPAASALAAKLLFTGAYAPMEAKLADAKAIMDSCTHVICCLKQFGPGNMANRELWEYAGSKQTTLEALFKL